MQVAAWNSCNDSWTCPEITVEVRCTFCFSSLSYPQLSTYCSIWTHGSQLPNSINRTEASAKSSYTLKHDMFWHSRILQDDHLPALPAALWEPSHKWHTHTWRHRIPITRHNQLRAALSYLKARLQTFRWNHAVAPLSLPCIPWIPGEKTRVSHSETVETGQETVWSNAGEGVKSVNTGHSDDY